MGCTKDKFSRSKVHVCQMSQVEQFVNAVLSNKKMADLLAPQMNQIASILSNNGWHIIKQLAIDHNLIEVKPFGTCFNINRKMLVESPLPDDQVGKVTPRAYVSYTYKKDKVPYPKKFVETIENVLKTQMRCYTS